MGVFVRPDSPVWWLWLETTRQKERTEIRIGTTAAQKYDSRKLAEDRYHQRMNEIAARLYKLPSATPTIRFTKYAETYRTDTIAHHKGAERERELLQVLVAFFGTDLLTAIDPDRVRSYMTARRKTVAAVTVNREVDLLKAMLRDAVPKYLTVSPIVGLARLKTIKPRRRLLLPVELKRLLAAADPVERALLILGYDGLIRLGDLLDLQPTDRRRGWLYVADPKADAPYEIALSRRAMLALDALPVTGKYYFQRYRGAKTDRDRRARVRRMLMKLCAKAHVPYGKKGGGITFHWATRRSGATRLLVKQNAPLPAVQRQGNWKTPAVLLAIYAEADRQDQQDAVFPKRSRPTRKSG
jgi:integrase